MEELKELFQEAGRRSPEALTRPEHYYDIELTYTSNAIEGNNLSAVETQSAESPSGIIWKRSTITTPSATLASWDGMKRPSPKVAFAIFSAWSCKGPPRRLLVSTRIFRVRVRTETGRHTFPCAW